MTLNKIQQVAITAHRLDITFGSYDSLNIIIKDVKLLLVALRKATHKCTIMACIRAFAQVVNARHKHVANRVHTNRMCIIKSGHLNAKMWPQHRGILNFAYISISIAKPAKP